MTNVFVEGTLVATDGTMQTTSDTPDGSAVRVAGIAHKPTGERYVTGWPDDGVVSYVNGQAITPSGQQVVLADTAPAIFRNGLGYSTRGELAAKTSGTPVGVGGFGVTADGFSIMTGTYDGLVTTDAGDPVTDDAGNQIYTTYTVTPTV